MDFIVQRALGKPQSLGRVEWIMIDIGQVFLEGRQSDGRDVYQIGHFLGLEEQKMTECSKVTAMVQDGRIFYL